MRTHDSNDDAALEPARPAPKLKPHFLLMEQIGRESEFAASPLEPTHFMSTNPGIRVGT